MKVLASTFDINNRRITLVQDPSSLQDAATKNYADNAVAGVVQFDGEVAVSGADYTTTQTTPQNITGLITPSLALSSLYEFEVNLLLNSTDTNGLAFAMSGSGGLLTLLHFAGVSTSNAGNYIAIGANGLDVQTAAIVALAGDGTLNVRGFARTGASGTNTIIAKLCKKTSGTAKCYIGSTMRWKKR